MDLREFKIDRDKVESGVWKRIGDSDVKILMRSSQSKFFQAAKKRIERPYRAKIRKNEVSAKEIGKMIIASIIEGGIIDWVGLTLDGEEILWSVENGYKFINTEDYPEFADMVINAFTETEEFLEKEVKENEKNSLTALNGNKSGPRLKQA